MNEPASYISDINPEFIVFILFNGDDKYNELQQIIPPEDIAITVFGEKHVFVDGERMMGYTKHHLKFIEAHEIAHHELGHRRYGDPEFEKEADLAAFILLRWHNHNEASDIVIDEFEGRHGIDFETYFKENEKRISEKLQ